MEITDNQIEKIKSKAKAIYDSFTEVYCPYLKKKVKFNIKGLDHIKFKGWKKARVSSDQFIRLKCIRYAPLVLENSQTLQGLQERKSLERVRINQRWETKAVEVKYYAFVAVFENSGIRVKIIIKEVSGGMPYFWSIIPFWKQKNDPIVGHFSRILDEGNLEED